MATKETEALLANISMLEKAVDDAVNEIKSLADQLAANSATPMVPEDAEVIGGVAERMKALAEALHGAVFPPSSATEM